VKIEFIIPGKPKTKARPRFNQLNSIVYTPSKTKQAQEEIGWLCCQAMHKAKLNCWSIAIPLEMQIVIYCKKLICKPDVDNTVKLIMDALCKVLYNDDRQIISLNVKKVLAKIPHTHVIIAPCNQ
jgi:Holliday junction resolvase RusA-like endonuclease